MAATSPSNEADAPAAAGGFDAAAALNLLRERGAPQADPVRFRFIEALARRAEGQPEAVRRRLEAKLAQAIDAYLARYPDGQADELPLPPAPAGASLLGELVQAMARAPAPPAGAAAKRVPAPTPELQALAYFRHTWAKLAVHRSLNQSIAKTPKNAGPLNSHRLVLRSLEVMREVSPDYLNRFVGYVDALLVLDGMGSPAPAPAPAPTPVVAAPAEKKRRPARGAGAAGRG
jgi:hypothetical protein